MEIRATDAANAVVERARTERDGRLSITLGTGCCDSTAPFLYENHIAGYDHRPVGEVAGVEVLAPKLLRELYEDDSLVIDVEAGPADSLSLETEWDLRLTLRAP